MNNAQIGLRDRFTMTAPQTVSSATPEITDGTGLPNQFHLHGLHRSGHSIRISYYPGGIGPLTEDGALILAYQDAHQSLGFRRKNISVVQVAGVGTLVTVTLRSPSSVDGDSTTATLLVPDVTLLDGQPATVETELLIAMHHGPTSGIGGPQRDHYSVVALVGQASIGPLPL